MKKYVRISLEILCWLMIAGVLMMMFSFSAQEADQSGELSMRVTKKIAEVSGREYEKMSSSQQRTVIRFLHPLVRKAAHFSEYALLGALFLCAALWRRWKLPVKIFAALNFSFISALMDELHQTFVAGRSGQMRDVLIDLSGAAAGILFVCILRIFVMHALEKRKIKKQAAVIQNYEQEKEIKEENPEDQGNRDPQNVL